MPTRLKRAALLLLAASGLCGGARADDPALLGCWRSQQVQLTFADDSRGHQNGDCVTEYDATHARTRCQSGGAKVELLSGHERLGPGHLRVTPLDAATGQPKAPPTDLHYRIEDDRWLLVDRAMAPAPAPTAAGDPKKQPRRLQSVSVRVRDASCEPRGDTGLRIGRTPRSSLAMTAPPGWAPLLLDPSADGKLAEAVGTQFFIGAFVPDPPQTGARASSPAPRVMVLDETRHGPVPVRAAEFEAVKRQFIRELGAGNISCDQPDRVCGSLKMPEGGQVYTELVPVQGRVAMVSATIDRPPPGAAALLRQSARAFVDRLLAANPP